jgi:hypothetical protein
VFERLKSAIDHHEETLPIWVPQDYADEDQARDKESLEWIPNLADGSRPITDVLAALEWRRTIWPTIVEDVHKPFIAIDCRNMPREFWEHSEMAGVLRGIAMMRMPVPIWFRQIAGQGIENWSFVRERPIFTEHTPNQHSWMLRATDFSWPSWYVHEARLGMSERLKDFCLSRRSYSPSFLTTG